MEGINRRVLVMSLVHFGELGWRPRRVGNDRSYGFGTSEGDVGGDTGCARVGFCSGRCSKERR